MLFPVGDCLSHGMYLSFLSHVAPAAKTEVTFSFSAPCFLRLCSVAVVKLNEMHCCYHGEKNALKIGQWNCFTSEKYSFQSCHLYYLGDHFPTSRGECDYNGIESALQYTEGH